MAAEEKIESRHATASKRTLVGMLRDLLRIRPPSAAATDGLAMGPYGVAELDTFLGRSGPNEFYRKFGFGLYREAIPAACIEKLFQRLESEVYRFPGELRHFFTGARPQAARTDRFTDDGVLAGGLEQPLSYSDERLSGFVEALREVVCHPNILRILREVDGGEAFSIEQTIFFTESPATVPHIDSFSADSWPRGHSHTIWLALEDIPLEAGPPYVVPVSKKTFDMEFPEDHPVRSEQNPDAAANRLYYEGLLQEWEQLKDLRYFTPLSKGDLMIWHSLTIHGSMQRDIQGGHRYSIQALYRDMKRGSGSYLGPNPIGSERINENFYLRRR